MMEILIKIPKELYETYKGRPPMLGDAGMDMIAQSIANGKPLPEHHGRLIDADELEEYKEIMTTLWGESKYAIRMDDIRNMPTIIEAEGSESE